MLYQTVQCKVPILKIEAAAAMQSFRQGGMHGKQLRLQRGTMNAWELMCTIYSTHCVSLHAEINALEIYPIPKDCTWWCLQCQSCLGGWVRMPADLTEANVFVRSRPEYMMEEGSTCTK